MISFRFLGWMGKRYPAAPIKEQPFPKKILSILRFSPLVTHCGVFPVIFCFPLQILQKKQKDNIFLLDDAK